MTVISYLRNIDINNVLLVGKWEVTQDSITIHWSQMGFVPPTVDRSVSLVMSLVGTMV